MRPDSGVAPCDVSVCEGSYRLMLNGPEWIRCPRICAVDQTLEKGKIKKYVQYGLCISVTYKRKWVTVHLWCSTELGGWAQVSGELCLRNPDRPWTQGSASWNRPRYAFLSVASRCTRVSTPSGHDSGNLRSIVKHTHIFLVAESCCLNSSL